MSIIETLTEGIVNRDMKKEGAALLSKWGKTGLLEGLQNEHEKAGMARLLENQAKELLRESSSMSAGDVEGFAAVAFPIVRRVFAGLIANQLVSVQPMSLPSGLIFFLDFTYSSSEGKSGTQVDPRFGNKTTDGSEASIYGTDKVGSGVIDGVNLLAADKSDLSGPGRGGMVGYAYASPSGSNLTVVDASAAGEFAYVSVFPLDGNVSEANKKLINYDADLLSVTDGTDVIIVDIAQAQHDNAGDSTLDLDNLSAFQFTTPSNLAARDGDIASVASQVRRLTTAAGVAGTIGNRGVISQLTAGAASIRYYFLGAATAANIAQGDQATGNIAIDELMFPIKDNVSAKTNGVGALDGFALAQEGIDDIPEIDIKVDSTAITAQTKKLKAKWTPELGQDLNAYHNLDAEVELTSILSEQIALEIDREILADLVNGATAATYYWSRSPGLFVNKETGAELGATSAAPDFTGTVSEWYETLIETINDVSAQIHRKTLRGGANYVIVSPEVANILEFTSGFRANVTADVDKGEIGAVKVGALSRKFDVIVDPYFPRNVILVGRKGNSFLESGYVYAPYVPLQTTPTIFDPESFVPRKGVMTRYAKKMVRPDMYGLVICRGLLGESGS